MKTKIAYQGEKYSNSEYAANRLAKLASLNDIELVPSRTSLNVVKALRDGVADYGVVALENSTFGEVRETQKALNGLDRTEKERCTLPIHHCLFSSSKDITLDKIELIYSHPQALGECLDNLDAFAPEAERIEAEDTAFSAQLLADGELSPRSGVICRREAGEALGLHMLKANIEDSANNSTTFLLFSAKPSSILPKVPLNDRVISFLCSPFFVRWGISSILIITIFLTLILNAYIGWSNTTIATSLVGTISTGILAVTSPKYLLWAQHRRVVGYWRYKPIPKRNDAPKEENHHIERLVVIDRVSGQLRFRGWQSGDGEYHRWQSIDALFKHSSDASGQLVYDYKSTLSHKQANLVGIVSLYWNTSDPAQIVSAMNGLYYGHGATQDDGTLNYSRISFSEFERLRFSSGMV